MERKKNMKRKNKKKKKLTRLHDKFGNYYYFFI